MLVRGLMTFALVLALTGVAEALVLSVPGTSEQTALPSSGAASTCGGQNVSPPLSWTDVPAGITSFALVLFDADATAARTHWVIYGIPGTLTSIPAGYKGGIGGTNTSGDAVFGGYCPPPGAAPHHYTFNLIATDLAPAALQPGLTRDGLLTALAGHAKGTARFVGLYGR